MATTKLKKLLGEAGAGLDDSVIGPTLYQFLLAQLTELEALRAAFNLHTHKGDGSQGGVYNVSMPQSDTQTITPVTALVVAKSVEAE
jgi:hypothetical protein